MINYPTFVTLGGIKQEISISRNKEKRETSTIHRYNCIISDCITYLRSLSFIINKIPDSPNMIFCFFRKESGSSIAILSQSEYFCKINIPGSAPTFLILYYGFGSSP